jgi:ribosome-binding ATPase YchF (GTP1/OBG family)
LNSTCINGWRYVPVRIIDVPGLIKDASKGRGLGNQFLSVIGSADALIHVVDASGSIDADGYITKPGSGNPIQDAIDTEVELKQWLNGIIMNNKQLIIRDESHTSTAEAIAKPLLGIKANMLHVSQALEKSELTTVPFAKWTNNQTYEFAGFLLPIIKPTLIVANKMDILTSERYFEMLTKFYGHSLVAACSAEAELVLRRAEKMGVLEYTPGEEKFRIKENAKLSSEQKGALKYVKTRVMDKFMRTGIQQALNTIVFKLLKMNMIYGVSDEEKYSDHHGNVLPDVHLLHDGSTPFDLAKNIHSSLAEDYGFAIDAKTGVRLPADYALRHKDVIKIRTLTRKKARRASSIFRKVFPSHL